MTGDARLKGEVLRVQGRHADLQIFEETQGVRVGDSVELTTQMLSATLGPGLPGDGLRRPAKSSGGAGQARRLLPGARQSGRPARPQLEMDVCPSRKPGERLRAGDVIGTVPSTASPQDHDPLCRAGRSGACSIEGGEFTVDEPVAHIRDAAGRQRALTLSQEWPVRARYRSACCAAGCASAAIPWNR